MSETDKQIFTKSAQDGTHIRAITIQEKFEVRVVHGRIADSADDNPAAVEHTSGDLLECYETLLEAERRAKELYDAALKDGFELF